MGGPEGRPRSRGRRDGASRGGRMPHTARPAGRGPAARCGGKRHDAARQVAEGAKKDRRGADRVGPSEARHMSSRRSRHEKDAGGTQTVPDPRKTSRRESDTVGGGGVRGAA